MNIPVSVAVGSGVEAGAGSGVGSGAGPAIGTGPGANAQRDDPFGQACTLGPALVAGETSVRPAAASDSTPVPSPESFRARWQAALDAQGKSGGAAAQPVAKS